MINFIGYVAAVLTVLAFVPQAYKAVKTRKTRDVSLTTFATLITSGTLWSIYGFGLHKPAIYIPNILVGCMALMIVVIKIQDRD